MLSYEMIKKHGSNLFAPAEQHIYRVILLSYVLLIFLLCPFAYAHFEEVHVLIQAGRYTDANNKLEALAESAEDIAVKSWCYYQIGEISSIKLACRRYEILTTHSLTSGSSSVLRSSTKGHPLPLSLNFRSLNSIAIIPNLTSLKRQ